MGCNAGKEVEDKVLILGPCESGKTCLLYTLKLHQPCTTIPTIGVNTELVKIGKKKRVVWDVGGKAKDSPHLRHVFVDPAAVVYVINGADDKAAYMDSLDDMDSMLSKDQLSTCPVAVAVNKSDLEDVRTTEQVKDDLKHKTCLDDRKWKVFSISAMTEDGMPAMLKWVDKQCKKSKEMR